MLSAAVQDPGKLTLEGKTYFDALPVRQGNNKAMQLLTPVQALAKIDSTEDESHASS